ncbi:MAG: C39 family peptidase [Anaerolineales bacterium]|nr:C39 family peptidase [Anaerolineales bacterium]
MFKNKWTTLLFVSLALVLVALLVYQIPAVNQRLYWRFDIALTYLRGVINPVEAVPTPQAQRSQDPLAIPTSRPPVATPTATSPPASPPAEVTPDPSTPTASPTLPPSPTPRPQSVNLPAPGWEQQDWNNCGPAALSMYLHYYGWEGDQYGIAQVIKPARNDRNVNIEELAYYARNYAGWLVTQYRVGGNLELLKEFVAAEIPVLIEASFFFEGPYWPNDDLWAAHYLLVTGYDEAAQTFIVQDTYHGPNQVLSDATVDEYWQPFNRLYALIYLPQQEETVQAILSSAWDVDANRQQALESAQAEIEADPADAFAWFNLGTNLVYFERYEEAAEAYDQARTLGLPQRMLRYQFGPFFAYFHTGRIDDLLTLTEYALQRTPVSEEAHLWHGWALYRQGDLNGALGDFRMALSVNPNMVDAQYAIDFILNQ